MSTKYKWFHWLMTLLFLTGLLGGMIISPAHAQENDPPLPFATQALRFTHLTTSDGLANAHVEVIFQDRQGFMWFGTRDGLSRYDGYRFTTYRQDMASTSTLSGNSITDIVEDAQGRLWFATNGGVSMFDPSLEQFSPIPLELPSPSRVFSLFRDSQDQIWLGTNSDILLHYNPVTKNVTTHALPSDMPRGTRSQVWDIVEDQNGNLWLAASSGVIKFTPRTQQFKWYTPSDDTGEIRSLYVDETGNLWFDGLSLREFDPVSENIISYSSPLSSIPIIDLLVDQTGQMWLATLQGLFQFDLRTKHYTGHFIYQPSDPYSLSSTRTFSLFEDTSGLLWIGTQNAGLNLFDPRQNQFTRYQHDPEHLHTLATARVTSITGDASGHLWIGTDAILNYFDPSTGQVEHYQATKADDTDPFGISVMFYDRDGHIWMGLNNQLHRFNPEDKRFTTYNVPEPIGGPPTPFTSIYQDETGVLWLGRQRQVFLRFDTQTETFQPPSDNINMKHVQAITDDSNGTLWLTGSGSLSRFIPQSNRFDSYQTLCRQTNMLYTDPNGIVWLAANDGLCRFDPAAANAVRYTDKKGLPSSSIQAVLADATGNLWLSTRRGLVQFAPQNETFHAYDVDDGLASNEFIFGSAWQSPDGRMYFGSEQGLTAFYPDQIRDNTYQPPVVLTQISLFNEPLPIGEDSLLPQAINFADHLTFSHDQDIISFEFAALSYAAPHKNRYRYILEGLEETWNEVNSDRRFATYTSLPAGDYVFRVQGSNNSGVWSTHEVALPVTVLPPWWATTWFRMLAGLSIIGLILGGVRWRVQDLKQHNRNLEQQVTERTKELYEQHLFLQTVLNSLAHPFYVINAETWMVEMANSAAKADPLSKDIPCYALLHGYEQACEAPEHPCPLEMVKQTKQPAVVEHTHIGAEGQPQAVEVHSFPIFNQDGEVVQVIEYTLDITERKRFEAQQQHLAAIEERERIGRELHDDLGQVMGYVSVQAQAALARLGQQDITQTRAILHQLVQVAQDAHEDVRQYILGVRTGTSPAPHDLFTVLEKYLRTLQERYSLTVHVSWPDDLLQSPLAPEVETQLLRVIQEALTNVRKHAGVTTAQLIFTIQADQVQVMIEDHGRGFDAHASTEHPGHFGLQIMRERAESVGGTLELRTAPEKGTLIIVQMPCSLVTTDDAPFGRGLRVLLVDDHPLYLEGLHSLLSARGLQIVGEAHDGLEAQKQAETLRPNLILMDVQMPRCDGVEATRRIKALLPDVKIIMLTMAADAEILFEALKAGASGYLLKNLAGTDFFNLLRGVARGETVISPMLGSRVLSEFAQTSTAPGVESEITLTARQTEVLELVAQGLSNKEIAAQLFISERTVKYHVSQILERLQLKSRHQLADYVERQDG